MKMDLTERLIKQCVAQPETGMGWQSVTVILVDRSEHQGMVYGSSDLELDLDDDGTHKDFIHPNMIEEIIVNTNNKYNHNAFSGGDE
jgi:hypothetical protein